MNSVRSNTQSLTNQIFTPSCCEDKVTGEFEWEANDQFLKCFYKNQTI